MSGDSALNKALVAVSFFSNALNWIQKLKKRLQIQYLDILIANLYLASKWGPLFGENFWENFRENIW